MASMEPLTIYSLNALLYDCHGGSHSCTNDSNGIRSICCSDRRLDLASKFEQ